MTRSEPVFRALVTGGNRGLGLAIVHQLLTQGYEVHALNRSASDSLKDQQAQFPDHLFLYEADVRDEDSVKRAVAQVAERVDGLELIVNNAAIHPDPERVPLEDADFSRYLEAFDINAVGPLRVLKYALSLVRKGREPRVVNISSEAGSCADNWRSSEYGYCMSKAALNRATMILHEHLKDTGVRVFAMHPGWFSSDMGGQKAPITPEDAASNIIKLLTGPAPQALYVGPDGQPMAF
ncbi:MAG: SDR family NAD(P)-dependent oxidoreductase [Verrucomicrobiota bacterium JB022]|nr:SDR family NAD(P)-dependent oxidoreductase [Verrucomicrobiota bacterium JB022]